MIHRFVPASLLIGFMIAFLAACGSKTANQGEVLRALEELNQRMNRIENKMDKPPNGSHQEDGQVVTLWETPKPAPDWLTNPGKHTDERYLAFKGTSRDAAQQQDAETNAIDHAAQIIAGFLSSRVDREVLEAIFDLGVSSSAYDPGHAREEVIKRLSSAIVERAYPSEQYIQRFQRMERGRWVQYYQVQVLVLFPYKELINATAQKAENAEKERKIQGAYELLKRAREQIDSQTAPPDKK